MFTLKFTEITKPYGTILFKMKTSITNDTYAKNKKRKILANK